MCLHFGLRFRLLRDPQKIPFRFFPARHKSANKSSFSTVLDIYESDTRKYDRTDEINDQIFHRIDQPDIKITSQSQFLTIHRHTADPVKNNDRVSPLRMQADRTDRLDHGVFLHIESEDLILSLIHISLLAAVAPDIAFDTRNIQKSGQADTSMDGIDANSIDTGDTSPENTDTDVTSTDAVSYTHLELKKLKKQCPDAAFDGLEKLQSLYTRGKEKGVRNPESYALKNWIVRVQGFLINCATFGFTSNYEAIMSGTYKKDLFYGTFGEQLMDLLGRMAYENVFCSRDIYRMEISESVMLDFLMDQFVGAVLYYDTNHPLGTIDERLVSFISDNYRNAYRLQTEGKNEAEKLYLRLLLVTDFVCGMTDGYAKRLYQEMKAML